MNKTTHVLFIGDRSGSMSNILNDAVGGYNHFISEQRKLKDVFVTLILFDDKYEEIYKNQDPTNVPDMTADTWMARGSTALLDAMGKGIGDLYSKLDLEKKLDDQVIVVIITDGYENSSKEFNADTIKDLIKSKEAIGWKFVFLASDMSTVQVASKSYGISADTTFVYNATSRGMANTYTAMACAISGFHMTGNLDTTSLGTLTVSDTKDIE